MRKKRNFFSFFIVPAIVLGLTAGTLSVYGDDLSLISQDESSGSAGAILYQGQSADASSAESGTIEASESGTYTSNNGTVFSMPSVSDNSARVYDYAGLFSDEEIEKLTVKIEKVEKSKDCDIVVLTSSDVPEDAYGGTETSEKYAEQFYIDNGFKSDGMIFIIDMNNRVLWSAGTGKYKTQHFIDYSETIYNDALSYASQKDYYGAAGAFIHDADKFENVLYALIPTPVSLAISAVLVTIVLLITVLSHSKSQPSVKNDAAVKTLNYRQVRHDSTFLGKNVTSHRIPKDTGGGRSGGGGGGFSGGFSSGGGGFSGSGGGFAGGGGHF